MATLKMSQEVTSITRIFSDDGHFTEVTVVNGNTARAFSGNVSYVQSALLMAHYLELNIWKDGGSSDNSSNTSSARSHRIPRKQWSLPGPPGPSPFSALWWQHRSSVPLQVRDDKTARYTHSRAFAFEIHLNHKNNTYSGEARELE